MQTLHKKDHLANTCKHYHCLWVCLWLLLWVWLELNHFLMALFWRWFCWKQWLCVCVFPCLALSSCTRINKQYINSITEITAPWLEGPSHPHTSSIQSPSTDMTFVCSPCLYLCVLVDKWSAVSALHHVPVCAHLEEAVLLASTAHLSPLQDGCHVATIQIAQLSTDQNPT